MKKKYLTENPSQTKKIGQKLALAVLKLYSKRKGLILALSGELGSGKTTFIKGFAKGLGIEEMINSPTFVIEKRFKIKDKKFNNLYHLDCYRIKSPKEFLSLGLEEILSNPENIVVIEWGKKIKSILPQDSIFLNFKILGQKRREIIINFPNFIYNKVISK